AGLVAASDRAAASGRTAGRASGPPRGPRGSGRAHAAADRRLWGRGHSVARSPRQPGAALWRPSGRRAPGEGSGTSATRLTDRLRYAERSTVRRGSGSGKITTLLGPI